MLSAHWQRFNQQVQAVAVAVAVRTSWLLLQPVSGTAATMLCGASHTVAAALLLLLSVLVSLYMLRPHSSGARSV
jgi:hypothetical protein